ncbi:protein-L-isoaspartate(D-aspartate) O-methyltransferase [Methyloparacoccus murrellii]
MNPRFAGIGMTSRRTRERMIARLREQGVAHPDVLRVMLETPRHLFVEEALASRAYEDTALPIGFNQTISQPYIVARMTELLLESGPLDKVLEVGTGSGYQTAILAQLVKRVYSVERIYPLQQRARQHLQELQLRNVRFKHSDGGWGWEEYAPYDAILAAAAPSEIPETLLAQMARRSVMIIPVGQGDRQILKRVTRNESGFRVEDIEPVNFVPFLPGIL